MIKVLQVLTGGEAFGGVENFLYKYYKYINHNEIHFDFVLITHDSFKSYWSDDVLSESLHYEFGLEHREYVKIISKLKKILEKDEYDCIHINTGNVTIQYYCLIAAKQAGISCRISHSHSTGRNNKSILKKKLISIVQKRILSLSSVHLACSIEAGKHIFGNIDNSRITIIPNAIETWKYRFNDEVRMRKRSEIGLENNKTYMQIGNLYAVKNYGFTLDMLSKLIECEPNSQLVIVGGGELFKEIKNKIKLLKLQNNVKLLGYRNDVNELLAAADCVLMPSLWEGFPTVAIEAQASGTRIICSDSITRDVDVTGLCEFISINDIDAWVDACRSLDISKEDYYEVICEKGYDIPHEAKKLEKKYYNWTYKGEI